MKNLPSILFLLLISSFSYGQKTSTALMKKAMDESTYDIWNSIRGQQISNNGDWVVYNLKPGDGDSQLKIFNVDTKREWSFDRAKKATITNDSRFVIFQIEASQDSVKAMKRREVKKKDMPKDTLAIYNLATKSLDKIPDVKSFKVPEKWDGHFAFLRDIQTFDKKDTTIVQPKKKETKDSGTRLTIRNLGDNSDEVFEFVKAYSFSEMRNMLMFSSTGNDSTFQAGVYAYDCKKANLKPLHRGKGKYSKLTFNEKGNHAVFISDTDTTEAEMRPYELHHWSGRKDSAKVIVNNASTFLPENWIFNNNGSLRFSEDDSKLYFGVSPKPILQDENILKEEICNVEVWSHTDKYLYTQQESMLDREKKRTYLSVYDLKSRRATVLGNELVEEIRTGNEGNAKVALGYDQTPYLHLLSWEGGPAYRDVYLVDIGTGKKTLIKKKARPSSMNLSPEANYIYWYSVPDTSWMSYSIKNRQTYELTNNALGIFYDELNDRPMHPSSYRLAGWSKNDEFILIYDRYDIWKIHPEGKVKPQRLTKGRDDDQRTTYRYVRLDNEEREIDLSKELFVHYFNHVNKREGYAKINPKSLTINKMGVGDFAYSRRPRKARDSNDLLFTKSNHQVFPDLQVAKNGQFKNAIRVSDANPQQSDYKWSSVELYEWTSLDGQKLQGLLYKPDNFDPKKKYPMIVNFYERSSDRLNRHHAPARGRSTISYSFYLSRGYVIFNPDVPYRVGYPGESCYNAVIPGITSLIGEGFIDEKNIGAQGHSWGGYQIAYLVTKTNIFKCVEAGAPVVNMISAYGGIRWGSGMSRQFQYEHTQSRIGGTPWDYPVRYIENSPIFFADKIETPVLMMHNDEDGAVPWYQGIEFFTALRRLGKPVWLLNYNGEPHWAMKTANRKDFNLRMSQFFDHYLKGAAKPKWMESGVPAIQKGINQNYELLEKDK